MLVDFGEENRLHVMNSRFEKRESRKSTWVSPNIDVRNTIDYVLSREPFLFLEVSIVGSFRVVSDHRLLMAKLRIPTSLKRRQKQDRRRGKFNKANFSFALAATAANVPSPSMSSYSTITQVISAAAAIATQPTPRTSKLSDRTRSLFKQRHLLKSRAPSPTTRIEFSVVSKALRIFLKDDIRRRHLATMQEAVQYGRSLRKDLQKNFTTRTQLPQIQAVNGSVTSKRAQVGEIVRTFYNDLFASTILLQLQVFVPDYPLPPVIASEVKASIMRMKKGRSPGFDLVTAPLAELFNDCLANCQIPDQLPDSTISLIYKKGNNLDIANYRPIALLSTIYKVFTTIIGMRMEHYLDKNQPVEQAGFRKHYSTTDHIHSVCELIQKSSEYKYPLYLVFIDFKKAFDSVEFNVVYGAFYNHGVHPTLINIIQKIYATAHVDVKVNHQKVPIEVQRGVRQGDTISPQLFAAVVEDVFRTLDWDQKSVLVNGSYLNHLRYADDIVLFSHNATEAAEMMAQLANASQHVGLLINTNKTYAMTNSTLLPLMLNGSALSYEDQFIYLGQRVSFDSNPAMEIQRRTRAGWFAFNKYHDSASNLLFCTAVKVGHYASKICDA